MFRPAFRAVSAGPWLRTAPVVGHTTQRFASTMSSSRQSGGVRSFLLRIGLAGAAVYYYNTSSVFADEPAFVVHAPPETSRETETYPTIEAVAEQRRSQPRQQARTSPSETSSANVALPDAADPINGPAGGLEEEASEQGAFNEETGEINWDCPCLGGMATGPCGEQFKAAFSCFVYSKEEPKGVDCIEHFKTMQTCFRDHPDVYGAELEDDDVPPPEAADDQPGPVASEGAPAPAAAPLVANIDSPHGRSEKVSDQTQGRPDPEPVAAEKHERAQAATEQVKQQHRPASEIDEVVPKAWHDTRSDSTSQ